MRIRPLRPSSLHHDEPITMPDPPESMRAAVIDSPDLPGALQAMQQAEAQFDNELIAEVVAELFAPTSSVG